MLTIDLYELHEFPLLHMATVLSGVNWSSCRARLGCSWWMEVGTEPVSPWGPNLDKVVFTAPVVVIVVIGLCVVMIGLCVAL